LIPLHFCNQINPEAVRVEYVCALCRGIDAPESAMPYGKEAKEALLKLVQGKSLKVYVYDEDRYGRCVGDIYCDGVFVQVGLLHSLACAFLKIAFSPERETHSL